MLNPIAPPWYAARMRGDVTGTAREGLAMSIYKLGLIFLMDYQECKMKVPEFVTTKNFGLGRRYYMEQEKYQIRIL